MAIGKKTGGRQPGSPNKVTAAAKEAFQLAFDGVGGVEALTTWARRNPDSFYKLYARLIPVEVADVSEPRGVISAVPLTQEEWAAKYSVGDPISVERH